MAIVTSEENGLIIYNVGGTPEDTFDITFSFVSSGDVEVYVDGVIEPGAVIVGAGVETGGGTRQATLPAPVSNVEVRIVRDTRPIRTSSFDNVGRFSAGLADREFDRIMLMLQDALEIRNMNFDVILEIWEARDSIIRDVATPVNNNDATNKIYVDTLINNLQTLLEAADADLQAQILNAWKEAIASATAPTVGDYQDNVFWYEEGTGKTFILYNDGITRSWVLQADPTQDWRQYALLREQRDAGLGVVTTGVANTWVARKLNVARFNSIPGLTLDDTTGRFTGLPVGFYRVQAGAMSYGVGAISHKLQIYNVTQSTTMAVGKPEFLGPEGAESGFAPLLDYFEVTSASDVFELQHNNSTNVFGAAKNVGIEEIYAEVELRRFG